MSSTEAADQDKEVPEATPAGDPPQETQSKRKRKAQSKKQLEGVQGTFFSLLFIILHLLLNLATCHLIYIIIIL